MSYYFRTEAFPQNEFISNLFSAKPVYGMTLINPSNFALHFSHQLLT